MIHVLDFNDNIIDFISDKNNYITQATMTRDTVEENDTYDFVIDSDRAYNLRERNRIIVQDRNGVYREYIIVNTVDDIDDLTTVQCNASYVEDLTTAKPYKPGGFTKYTTTQALDDITKDTGWETSDETEYGGIRSSSWTSYQTRYEVARQMRTTYSMELDFYIELSSNTVAHRYVALKEKNAMFKGKEIVYGKDLLTMTRTVDISEIHTALYAIGPEDEAGKRTEVVVTDDEAQEQFGLQGRYIWGVYEPESDDSSMTETRLTTLARTQLNKDKQAAVSYEITSVDLSQQFPHEQISLGDTVRIKDTEFNPPLYVDAEVVGEVYDDIAKVSTFTFGNVKEYKADELRKDLYDRISEIQKKMNDNISNVNTIVADVVAGQLEYFERKIIKSETPPENPINDMLWYDTSNPEVAVLRRYWNGEWLEETASDVEKIGGITREKALYSELTNTFTNLSIQHAKLQSDVYEVVTSEYLIDDDLKAAVNGAYNETTNVFNNIKSNLDSMKPETATIGKLVDTQALFLRYRERMQVLYKAVENAKIAIDKRFKLLQSQYTDEKFNDAMEQIAATLPNGEWDSENNQLLGEIPSRSELAQIQNTIIQYMVREIGSLNEAIGEETDYKINVVKNEIGASINSVKKEIDGIDTSIQDAQNEAIVAAKSYADAQDKLKETELQAYADGVVDEVEQRAIDDATTKLNEAKVYAEQKANYAKNAAITESDRLSKEAEQAAKSYADAQDELQQVEAQAYADGIVDAEEQRAIQDATDKLNAAKTYAETKATEAKNAAITDTSNKLKPITTRVTTSESNIKVLQDGLKLTATKTEVQQTLNDKLTPIQNQVNEQKATLDVLPSQIASKVSKSDYTTDQNNIVSRLNNADTERVQMANSIADKVTLKEFNDLINTTTNLFDVTNFENGTFYTATGLPAGITNDRLRSIDFIDISSHEYTMKVHNVPNDKVLQIVFYQYDQNGIYLKNSTFTDVNDTLTTTFDSDVKKVKMLLRYNDSAPISQSDLANMNIKFEVGNIANPFAVNPDDMERRLNILNTSLQQNGRDIQLRATSEEFNASRKTLSKVVSDLTVNTTTGITLSYDENGVIQSSTVGPDGVKIDASKIDINNGDVVIKGGVTSIKDAYIDKLFSKNAFIEKLKATDIDLNRATVYGGDDLERTVLSGGKIRSTGLFTRTFLEGDVTYEAYTESFNGSYRSGLISKQYGRKKLTDITRWLALTDKTITTQREIHSLSPDKRGARFIDFFADETYSSGVVGQGMHIYSGQDLTLESKYRMNILSSEGWYTRFLNGGIEVQWDGAGLVLKRQTAFTSTPGSGGNYITLQASDGVEHGHMGIISNNRHLSLKSEFGEVHLRGNVIKAFNSAGSSLNDIVANTFDLSGVGRLAFVDGDTFVQGQTGVRCTKYKSNTFVSVQAKDFIKGSSREIKKDIETLENGLRTVRKMLPVSYRYKDDDTEDIGFIAEDNPDISVENGKAVSVQQIATWAILAIKELDEKVEALKNKL